MDCKKRHASGEQQEKKDKNRPDEKLQAFIEDMALQDRLAQIKYKIMILSGKGGVGKSTVAVNIAVSLGLEGKKVGILDADFHGPSIPTLLHLSGKSLKAGENGIEPIDFVEGVKVMSIGFFMAEQDKAVIWRGPMKISVIKQLLAEVNWGELDYLIIDFPPGTGDEPLSVAQLIPDATGAIIVTTPQDLSLIDVRKSIDFCKQLNLPILGVIENMSGLVCPHCEQVINVFKRGGGEKMSKEMGVPFLGRIPIEPLIVDASDSGKPFVYHYGTTAAASAFSKAVKPILLLKDKMTSH
jgi:Mrp family chromosome partitioning ATPase